jgi:hypothetical protein
MMFWSCLVASGRERKRNHEQLPQFWQRITEGHQFNLGFATQFLCQLGRATKLRTFQIQSIFVDPNVPLSRIAHVDRSQSAHASRLLRLLCDAGRPDFATKTFYGYYSSGIFLQLAYCTRWKQAKAVQTDQNKAFAESRAPPGGKTPGAEL